MITGDPVASPANSEIQSKVGNFRWFICGLLFYATTVNYMDRVVMGILKTTISKDLHWNDTDYGTITAVFPPSTSVSSPFDSIAPQLTLGATFPQQPSRQSSIARSVASRWTGTLRSR